jgi:hypothetical protein
MADNIIFDIVIDLGQRTAMAVGATILPPFATMSATEPATASPQPAEATAKRELSAPGPAATLPSLVEVAAGRGPGALGTATTLLLPAEAALVRKLGVPGTASAFPPPAKAAATHAYGVANNPVRAEAAPFNKAGSSLQPTGTKAAAHPRTAGNASLISLLAWNAALWGRPRARVLNSSPRVGATEASSAGSRTSSSRRPKSGGHSAGKQAR